MRYRTIVAVALLAALALFPSCKRAGNAPSGPPDEGRFAPITVRYADGSEVPMRLNAFLQGNLSVDPSGAIIDPRTKEPGASVFCKSCNAYTKTVTVDADKQTVTCGACGKSITGTPQAE